MRHYQDAGIRICDRRSRPADPAWPGGPAAMQGDEIACRWRRMIDGNLVCIWGPDGPGAEEAAADGFARGNQVIHAITPVKSPGNRVEAIDAQADRFSEQPSGSYEIGTSDTPRWLMLAISFIGPLMALAGAAGAASYPALAAMQAYLVGLWN
jgi:hypothetical protein